MPNAAADVPARTTAILWGLANDDGLQLSWTGVTCDRPGGDASVSSPRWFPGAPR